MDYGGKGKVWLGERQEQIMIERQGRADKGGGIWMGNLLKKVGSENME